MAGNVGFETGRCSISMAFISGASRFGNRMFLDLNGIEILKGTQNTSDRTQTTTAGNQYRGTRKTGENLGAGRPLDKSILERGRSCAGWCL